jgi:hypothetical protein
MAPTRNGMYEDESALVCALEGFIAEIDRLLSPETVYTMADLESVKEKADQLLLELGPQFGDIRQEVKAMPFNPTSSRWRKRALLNESTGRVILPRHWNKEKFQSYVNDQLKRLRNLLLIARQRCATAGASAGTMPTETRPVIPMSSQRPKARLREMNLSVPERRAATVGEIIEELNQLRPGMTGTESDYDKLRSQHPRFVTFKVARKYPDLKEKVLNLQSHRRHIRLAQELAAAFHERNLSTVQTDWKRHKPDKYRQHVQK